MGTSSSTAKEPQNIKKIIIVGASHGCKILTKNLQDLDPNETLYEILHIDKAECFEDLCVSYKAFCDTNILKDISCPFDIAVKSYQSKRVTFKQGRLVQVFPQNNQIEIKVPNSDQNETITYDILVLCTGANYCAPWRSAESNLESYQDRESEVAEVNQKIKDAKSVLCVGAGSTGIEMAGYLKDSFPDKKVGICQRGNILLPQLNGAHQLISNILNRLDINIHTGTTYSQDSSIAKEYEFAIDCRGYQFFGPSIYFKQHLKDCLNKKNGQILVNKYGQITNQHPFVTKNQLQEKTYNNIFSFGDVCFTPVKNDVKSVPTMYQLGPIVSYNIYQVAIEQEQYKEMPELITLLQAIPVGKKYGLFIGNSSVKEDQGVPNMKLEIQKLVNGTLKGDPKAIKHSRDGEKFINIYADIAKGCCVFLPFHINKAKPQYYKEFENQKKDQENYY